MTSKHINGGEINKILKRTVELIDSSRGQILKIVDNLRKHYEIYKQELDNIQKQVAIVIVEVDELQKEDKMKRLRLMEVSKYFNIYSEDVVKEVYEKAYEIRIKLSDKINEEKILRERRTRLEIELKKSLEDIGDAEKIVSQVSIALQYLDGDIKQLVGECDKNSEMSVGIKILEAQENERKRIARDVHDGPAQYMANAVIKTDICKKVLEKSMEEGFKELSDLKENVKAALKEVRNIIFDLRPISLEDSGLNKTIQHLANSFSDETGITVTINMKPVKNEIEAIIQVAVYRIIQEIINNIKKHSKAKNVTIMLDFGSEFLMLVVSDDGIGFDVMNTLDRIRITGGSFGLIGLLDRVDQLQGKIDIKSSRVSGTTYRIALPVNREVVKNGR